jgi:hypothetical protein
VLLGIDAVSLLEEPRPGGGWLLLFGQLLVFLVDLASFLVSLVVHLLVVLLLGGLDLLPLLADVLGHFVPLPVSL